MGRTCAMLPVEEVTPEHRWKVISSRRCGRTGLTSAARPDRAADV